MTASKYYGAGNIAMRAFRLVLCFIGLAVYLLVKQFVGAPFNAPNPLPLHQQGNFPPGSDKLELMQEPDLPA
jgi:hypothetical protein